MIGTNPVVVDMYFQVIETGEVLFWYQSPYAIALVNAGLAYRYDSWSKVASITNIPSSFDKTTYILISIYHIHRFNYDSGHVPNN